MYADPGGLFPERKQVVRSPITRARRQIFATDGSAADGTLPSHRGFPYISWAPDGTKTQQGGGHDEEHAQRSFHVWIFSKTSFALIDLEYKKSRLLASHVNDSVLEHV